MKSYLSVIVGLLLLASSGHAQEKLALDLNRSLELAFSNNPEVVNAQLDIQVAEADLAVAKGRFLPSLESRLSHNRKGTSSLTLSKTRGLVNTNQSYSMDTNLSWNLFSGGRNLSALKAERISKQMAELNYQRVKQNIALKVAERYLACLKAKKMVEISQQALERSKAQLERTEALFQVGSVPQADVMGQRVQLGREKLKLVRAKMDYKNATVNLLCVLGIEPQGQQLELKDVETDLAYEDIGFEEAFQRALENRKDFTALKKSLQVARYNLKASEGSLLPSLSAYVSYGLWDVALPHSFRSLSKIDNLTYGLVLSIPIFERFQHRAEIQRARLNSRKVETQLEESRRRIALEVSSALDALKMAKEAIAVAGENLKAARENLRLAEERYRLGSGTLLDQITVSVQLREAEADYVNGLYDLTLAWMRLKNATGTLGEQRW
ncbi:MAG: hypothetical protein DRQ02_08590 [Candidatus Latescibacterota bacterium]|nr:MAG: hypothetical protein DRQ02_08590 [Candidatus Latescibacterota bacterium]